MVRLSLVVLFMVAACGHTARSSRSPNYSSPTERSDQPTGGLSPETEAHMACVQRVDDENARRAQTDEPMLYVRDECGSIGVTSADDSPGSDSPGGDGSSSPCSDGNPPDPHCGCDMHIDADGGTCYPNGYAESSSSSDAPETARPTEEPDSGD